MMYNYIFQIHINYYYYFLLLQPRLLRLLVYILVIITHAHSTNQDI